MSYIDLIHLGIGICIGLYLGIFIGMLFGLDKSLWKE